MIITSINTCYCLLSYLKLEIRLGVAGFISGGSILNNHKYYNLIGYALIWIVLFRRMTGTFKPRFQAALEMEAELW